MYNDSLKTALLVAMAAIVLVLWIVGVIAKKKREGVEENWSGSLVSGMGVLLIILGYQLKTDGAGMLAMGWGVLAIGGSMVRAGRLTERLSRLEEEIGRLRAEKGST